MKVNWILEHFAVEDYRDEMVAAINEYDDIILDLHPFEYLKKDVKKELDACLPTVALCTIQLARELNRTTSFIPGAIYGEKQFAVNKYYQDYYKFMLNKEYMCLPFWALKKNKELIYRIFGNAGCVFIRPNSGGKSFTGFILDYDRFDRDLDQAFLIGENLEELVCITHPVNIIREWRLVIIDKKVIASSLYKENGRPNKEAGCVPKVQKFAELVINSVDNPPQACYTMDIAETKDGFSIVELNSMSCSGLYKCDITAVVRYFLL